MLPLVVDVPPFDALLSMHMVHMQERTHLVCHLHVCQLH